MNTQEIPLQISGQEFVPLAAFDAAMERFIRARGIPGASLAVSYQGRLVLARGYTLGDTDELIQPDSLFRQASISKTFAAVATIKLFADLELSLDAPFQQILHLNAPDGEMPDPRLDQVTVRHLLQHLGGWDRDIAFDPMFRDQIIAERFGIDLPISRDDIIHYMTGQPLQHDPGTKYAYSNYGYCLIGRIIEKLSGQSYFEYLYNTILQPLNLQRTKLGSTHERLANEVRYHSTEQGPSVFDASLAEVNSCYGAWNLENVTTPPAKAGGFSGYVCS